MTVVRTQQLLSRGQGPKELDRLQRVGSLVRVRHGAYADVPAPSTLDVHRQLIAGTFPVLDPSIVLSHVSAGVLHGLPSWDSMLGRVTVLRQSPGHGSRRQNLHVRLAPIEPAEVVELQGYPATSLERTAVDLACCLDYDRALAVMDAALHSNSDRERLRHTIDGARRRHGIGKARAALGFADGRSESVGESVSRVRMASAGLPAPQLQLNILDPLGVWLARCDFGWRDRGVLGEFDGRIKYVGTPEQVAHTVMREKQREANLRELGWVVVRWGWSDLADPAVLRRRIEAAFAQARSATIRGYAEAD